MFSSTVLFHENFTVIIMITINENTKRCKWHPKALTMFQNPITICGLLKMLPGGARQGIILENWSKQWDQAGGASLHYLPSSRIVLQQSRPCVGQTPESLSQEVSWWPAMELLCNQLRSWPMATQLSTCWRMGTKYIRSQLQTLPWVRQWHSFCVLWMLLGQARRQACQDEGEIQEAR